MDVTTGILLVIAGGALEGLFSLPVTRTPKWQWENIWGRGVVAGAGAGPMAGRGAHGSEPW